MNKEEKALELVCECACEGNSPNEARKLFGMESIHNRDIDIPEPNVRRLG